MFNSGVTLNARASWDRTAVNGGDALHLAALAIAPAVIRADEARLTGRGAPIGGGACPLVDPAEREGGAAVDAEVGEGGDSVPEAHDHQGFTRKSDWERPVG